MVRQGNIKFFARSSHSLHFCDSEKIIFWKTGTPTEGVLCVCCYSFIPFLPVAIWRTRISCLSIHVAYVRSWGMLII